MPKRSLTIPDHVVSETIDGEAVLLDLTTGEYYSLDPVGTRIWQLVEELGDAASIESALLREYAAEPRTIHVDLERHLAELTDNGLLVRAGETNAP